MLDVKNSIKLLSNIENSNLKLKYYRTIINNSKKYFFLNF